MGIYDGFRAEREALGARHGVATMARAKKKPALELIEFSRARDIPFNQLVLSQANVRRVKTGVSIEDVRIEHVLGRPTGVVEISVAQVAAGSVAAALRDDGWDVRG